MKTPRIANALEYIDSTLVIGAEQTMQKKRSMLVIKWCSVAACFTLVLAASIMTSVFNKSTPNPILPSGSNQQESNTQGTQNNTQSTQNSSQGTQNSSQGSGTAQSEQATSPSDKPSVLPSGVTSLLARPYKDISFSTGDDDEISYIPHWNERDLFEQYRSITVNGRSYGTRSNVAHRHKIDAESLGASLGFFEASGYDSYEKINHYQSFEVFEIKSISPQYAIAVKMENEYFSYTYNSKDAPATLGEFMSSYQLQAHLELNRFYDVVGSATSSYYALESDDYIWQILSECQNAPSVDTKPGKIKVSFTATSPILGAYKQVFCITADGYLQTNALDYSYVYQIGVENASKIISYAQENGTPKAQSQYYYYLVGTVTEIGDGYIVVDDSIRCADPTQGVAFKIIINSKRLERSIPSVGTTVSVDMIRDICAEDNNTIDFAVYISRCYITEDNEVVAPE